MSYVHDLRYALRTLRKSPGFALAAVLTLGLGIGVNTAIFSLLDAVLLRPLPYTDGERLVLLRQTAPRAGLDNVLFSVREVYDYREANRTLSGLVEHHSMSFTLLGREEPERVSTGVVSADFFDVLGVAPLHGRTFLPEDGDLGAEAVLVLSHGYWQRGFGADPGVVGEVFEMNDRAHTVVGVLPPIPQFPVEHDVYMPTSACPFRAAGEGRMDEDRSAFRGMTVFGRLHPESSLAQARSDFDTLAGRFAQDYPETYLPERGYGVEVRPLREELTRQARPTLFILLLTTGLVLLTACANVANLIVARLLRRQRELAIRASLGAGRGRLARQMVIESLLLTLTGGVLGLGLAYGGLDLLKAFIARFTPRAVGVQLDVRVLFFTLAVALLTGLVFGLLPGLRTVHLAAALREGSPGSGRGRHRLRGALIVAQVAVSLVLLVAAGLMIKSLHRLQQVDPGFDPERVLTAEISLNWSKYTTREDRLGFFHRLLDQLRAHPGVTSAALSNQVPLAQQQPFTRGFEIEGRPIEDGGLAPQMDPRLVSPGYFRTMDIPVLSGRDFTSGDDAEAGAVAIVDQSLARRHWDGEDPTGHRIRAAGRGDDAPWATIVGVVGDVRHYGLDEPSGEGIYSPVAQAGFASRVVIRTASEPLRMAHELKQVVWSLDPGQPVSNIDTLEEKKSASMASPRLVAALLGLFAATALLITAAGLAGVLAFSVSQRTREIGVRMALGARAPRILLMVLGQGMALVAAGLGLGLVASVFLGDYLGGLMAEFLFETRAGDPWTLLGVSAVLVAAAAVACLVPARRAVGVEPMAALRED